MNPNRTDYIAGLRALADLLETDPDFPLPYACGTGSGDVERMTFYYLGGDDPKAALAAFARAIPGTVQKKTDENTFRINGNVSGLLVQGVAYRKDVCERVVTGTREVERAVVVKPAETKTVTATEEVVEWVCTPLLAEATA